ncbi:MAG: shikimate dehydrogenase [Thermoplasmata archaeon]
MTKVAAVVLAGNARDAVRDSRTAISKGADLSEVRLDQFDDLNSVVVRKLASAVGSRTIATLRTVGQGGTRGPPEAIRGSLLREMVSARFAYVDFEMEADADQADPLRKIANQRGTILIASHHFSKPAEIGPVRDAIEACAAIGDIAKVAVPTADIEFAIQLVDLARSEAGKKHRTVLIGTGIAGVITRALADDSGQEIQYASWGPAAATGQLSLDVARRLRGRTPIVLGLVGHPIGHSISPAIHEAALTAMDLPGVYLPFDIEPHALDGFLQAADRLRIRGLNVTIPHKEVIAEKLDELDGDAERLGAVNTIVISDGWTKGHNTDVFGFRLSLRSLGLRMGGRKALVVGAGGAARAVVDVLVREGATVEVTNRTFDRAEALADVFDEPVDAVPLDALAKRGPWDLLVNATPVGTAGTESRLPVAESILAKVGYVYDLVYNPRVTPLIEAAGRLGKPATSGLEMLLHQAAKSFELWTGRSPSVEAMRRAAKEALP